MDPITTAIAAASALASDMVSSAVKDAYAGLKSLIIRKFGSTSAVAKSVNDLEANPNSKGQAMVVSEHVAETKADTDAEIMKAVRTLVEALKNDKTSISHVHVQAAMSGGVAGVVGAHSVSVGAMNIGTPQTEKKD